MIPVLERKATYMLNIPELSGGMNLRDGISLIQDNQLTDSINMWYKDGLLKTRPAVKSNADRDKMEEFVSTGVGNITVLMNPANSAVINNVMHVLEVTVISQDKIQAESSYSIVQKVSLRYIDNTALSVIPLGVIEIGYNYDLKCLAVQHNGDIYCYVRYETSYPQPEWHYGNEIYKIERLSEGVYSDIVKLTDADLYIPVILTNCRPNRSSTYESQGELMLRGGTMAEGYNLLGRYYRMIYSTYDISEDAERYSEPDGKTYTKMRYSLLYSINNMEFWTGSKTVTAEITDKTGTKYTHIVEIASGNSVEYTSPGDGLYMHVEGNLLYFSNSASSKDPAGVAEEDYIYNNMVITAPCPNSDTNWAKVTNMTQAVWYGNTSLGINGGSRLFLGGNTEEKEKALVVWSDLNNPLYFSENNYTYVGDKAQAVTAFGRQGESLIIFKEREIYSTQYQAGSVTAEELIHQSAVDLSAQLAYFPMVQIHAGIGCDCPGSVQLCRNRLIWADSSGRVYTLTSQNQYSERNVFEISQMIERKLRAETAENLQKAQSADWEGRYLLFVGSHVYGMDYNTYGYHYVSSYSKSEDANMLIPWYYWKLPVEPMSVISIGSIVYMLEYVYLGTYVGLQRAMVNMFYIDGFGTVDEVNTLEYTGEYPESTEEYDSSLWQVVLYQKTIHSLAQTKLFDFHQPAFFKNVPIVNVIFGNNGGMPITVKFITESKTDDESTITLNESEAAEYAPEYLHNRQFRPYSRVNTRFGIRFESEGAMAIDAISLQYTVLGGAK